MPSSLSYCFFKEQISKDEYILRPMLPVKLTYNEIEFDHLLMLDSGADYSMLKNEIVEDYFLVDVNSLRKGRTTSGIGGTTEIAWIDIDLEFGWGSNRHRKTIPFQIPVDRRKDPQLSIIGRIPFFYDFRVDFRMGYTDDSQLGKFVIYPEEHKRKAQDFDPDPLFVKR